MGHLQKKAVVTERRELKRKALREYCKMVEVELGKPRGAPMTPDNG